MQTPGFDRTRDVLVFLSIPKTGSTSLSEMLIDAIGPDASCHLPDRQVDAWNQGLVRMQDQLRRSAMRFRDRILRRDWALAQATFLHGHHPFWAPIPGWRRPVYITLMRDPLARTLSGYFYIRQKAERMRRMSPTKRRILSCDPDDFFLDLLDS
ncbi:MAG: sulfotransferase family 2 domain-containing protein, partial [Pseudomonadota bacterium]